MTTEEAEAILELAARYFRNQLEPGASSEESRETILEAAQVLLEGGEREKRWTITRRRNVKHPGETTPPRGAGVRDVSGADSMAGSDEDPTIAAVARCLAQIDGRFIGAADWEHTWRQVYERRARRVLRTVANVQEGNHTGGLPRLLNSEKGAERAEVRRVTIGREFASTLSDNRVHFAVVDGCLEVTFDSGDTTPGEALSQADTRELVAMLAARVLLDGEMVSADWHGLTTILDTLYPADVFTGESGDPGARIVVLARKLAEVTERAEKTEAAARDFAEALATLRSAKTLRGVGAWAAPVVERAGNDALARHPEYAPPGFLPGETGERYPSKP